MAALIDSHNKLVAIVQNDRPRAATRATGGGYDRELVRAIQSELQTGGYYTSGVDGLYGNGTRAAIVAYQEDNGLTADGRPTSDLLQHLQNGQ